MDSVLFFSVFTTLVFCSSLVHCNNNIPLVPALYIFGDSIVDGGNLLATFPVGVALPPSLGMNIAHYTALSLGLPLVPPSENSTLAQNSTTGVNYAFGGSGILPETNPAVPYFDKQIDNFESTIINHLVKVFSADEFVNHLSKSIYLVSFGINDYVLSYMHPTDDKPRDMEPEIFSKYLLQSLSVRLTRLYRMGARKFVIKSIWPLGCAPIFNTNTDICNSTINDIVLPYKKSLPLMLRDLATECDGFEYSYSDDFSFYKQLHRNTKKNGITNTTGMCWVQVTNKLCPDRDTYLYFDHIHPTQGANHIWALDCFNGTLCSPKNIMQLVGEEA